MAVPQRAALIPRRAEAVFGLADAVYSAVTDPEAFRFRGDTLGVDVSLAWVAPTLYAAALALAVIWLVRSRSSQLPADPGWARSNFLWLAGLAALLPVQFFLLRWGEAMSTSDQAGVILTIAQWFLIPFAIRIKPRPAPAS